MWWNWYVVYTKDRRVNFLRTFEEEKRILVWFVRQLSDCDGPGRWSKLHSCLVYCLVFVVAGRKGILSFSLPTMSNAFSMISNVWQPMHDFDNGGVHGGLLSIENRSVSSILDDDSDGNLFLASGSENRSGFMFTHDWSEIDEAEEEFFMVFIIFFLCLGLWWVRSLTPNDTFVSFWDENWSLIIFTRFWEGTRNSIITIEVVLANASPQLWTSMLLINKLLQYIYRWSWFHHQIILLSVFIK
jgi:hypothetical protein